ncbi:hypothetical protein GCM10009536_49090 [Streptomyces thermocarboxydus]
MPPTGLASRLIMGLMAWRAVWCGAVWCGARKCWCRPRRQGDDSVISDKLADPPSRAAPCQPQQPPPQQPPPAGGAGAVAEAVPPTATVERSLTVSS